MTQFGFVPAIREGVEPIPPETRIELQNEQLFRQKRKLYQMKARLDRQHKRHKEGLMKLEQMLLQNPSQPLNVVVELRKMIQELSEPGRKK